MRIKQFLAKSDPAWRWYKLGLVKRQTGGENGEFVETIKYLKDDDVVGWKNQPRDSVPRFGRIQLVLDHVAHVSEAAAVRAEADKCG